MPEGFEVVEAGHAIVTDLGRSAGADLGFSLYGALDQNGARLANARVGNLRNHAGDAVIEVTATRLVLRLRERLLLGFAGADPEVRIDDVVVDSDRPLAIDRGCRLDITPRDGARAYLAVHGGIAAARVHGSVAPDPALGIAGRLAAGDVVAVNHRWTRPDHAPFGATLFHPPTGPRRTRSTIPVVTDTDDSHFGVGVDDLFSRHYEIDGRSNAVGLRLRGPMPRVTNPAQLRSRAMPVGSIEVTGSGVIVLLRGRLTTAGYPVAAVVTSLGLDALGQAGPGDMIRFVSQSRADAIAAVQRARGRIDLIARRMATAISALGPITPVD